MKEDLRETFLDEVIDDWFDDNSEMYTEEPDDLYDRYGLSRGDF